MDELTIGDKKYISTKRAADLTGYAKDYVGQLCREGHVEAKMVGRSWYVLESSIRAHRFGAEEKKEEVIKEEKEAIEVLTSVLPETWERPRYISEEPQRIPELKQAPQPVSVPNIGMESENDTQRSITEMQEAWKEWFESRKVEEPLLETPEIIDAREEAYEEEKAEEAEEAEEEVVIPVHKIPAPRPEPVERHMDMAIRQAVVTEQPATAPSRAAYKPRRRAKRRSNLVVGALLIAIGLVAVAIAVIGSGFADEYLETNPVIKYLGGTSSIQK